MKTIWKFEVKARDVETVVNMPKSAEIIHVHGQNEQVCLWAIVDPEAEKEERRFAIVGTGHLMFDPAIHKYIGTAHVLLGHLVWHIFELVPEKRNTN